MEMMFVMGRGRVPAARQPALQRPCQWLRAPLQRQSYRRSGPAGLLGGHAGAEWGDGAVPPSLPA